MRKKLGKGIAVAAVVASVLLFGTGWSKVPLLSAPAKLDLTAPDAVIRSKGLSRLPADLLRVPLLHDLLTEDFLFYYENTEGRLGLKGTIRRIAYEHDVTLTDKLIQLALDEPADVALWRGHDGSLKYYAISMTRGKLARVIELAAKIAMKDRQLVMVGELSVEGKNVPLLALEYDGKRKMLLASRGDRVVVISDPGMVMTAEGDLTAAGGAMLADLLSADKAKQQRFSNAFNLAGDDQDHTIAVKTDFLSFSYQHFFPSLKALRFDFSGKPTAGAQGTWSTSVYLDATAPSQATAAPDAHALWALLPGKPGACSALPVDWSALARVAASEGAASAGAGKLPAQFQGPAVVCWYPGSRLHAPLFAAQLKRTEGADKMLEGYFGYAIRSEDAEGNDVPPARAATPAGDVVWRVNGQDSLHPMLARSGKTVYFSPDSALVEQALQVAHKRQPALSDSWKDPKVAADTMVVLGPGNIAQLAEREISISLPQQRDAELRGAANRYLLPRLEAIKKYPSMRLALHAPPKGAGWTALDWRPY